MSSQLAMRFPYPARSSGFSCCAGCGPLPSAPPLEHAVARVCREAGARVARHVRLADMNLDVPVSDERRVEVVAHGLPLWHGSQLALDATIVCALTRRGEPHPRADVQPGTAVSSAARRKPASCCCCCCCRPGLVPKPCNSCASSLDTGPPLSPRS